MKFSMMRLKPPVYVCSPLAMWGQMWKKVIEEKASPPSPPFLRSRLSPPALRAIPYSWCSPSSDQQVICPSPLAAKLGSIISLHALDASGSSGLKLRLHLSDRRIFEPG